MSELAERLRARLSNILQRPFESCGDSYRVSEPALFADKSNHFTRLTSLEPGTQSAFAVYARLAASSRLSPQLAEQVIGQDRDASLHWYLASYGPRLLPCRAPLAAADIAYLLMPDPLIGLCGALPRIVAWEALQPHSRAPALADPPIELAYWWTCERAPHLGIEDCLVPTAYTELLCEKPEPSGHANRFELALVDRDADLRALWDSGAARGLIDAYLALLAIETPGIIRFVPRTAPDDFAALLKVAGLDSPQMARRLDATFEQVAKRAGFQLATSRYESLDETGNRSLSFRDAGQDVASPALAKIKADVEVVGPIRQSSGLGQAARRSIETFERAGMKVLKTDFALGFPSPQEDDGLLVASSVDGPAGASVFHLNPDMLPLAYAAGPGGYAKRRAGFFFWELDAPASCDFLALDMVDAIWTATDFVRGIYANAFSGPIECVGLALPPIAMVDVPNARSALRQRLGLSPETFVCLSVFDGLSYAARKNPEAAIRAFQQAFPEQAGKSLVLKVHNRPARGTEGPQNLIWDAVETAIARDSRIHLIDETASYGEVLKLIAGANVFISLHRSEGFGLGPAEAMQLGTPVVVTAYGGTEDFCNVNNAYRVPYVLKPVGQGAYVHVEPGRVWADPDTVVAAELLRRLEADEPLRVRRAREAQRWIADNYSYDAIGRRYVDALDRLLAKP